MATANNLRILQQKIKNGSLLTRALLNSGEMPPTDEDNVVKQVDVFDNPITDDYRPDFMSILKQYIPDDNIINAIANAIGVVGLKEFVLNYNSYKLKLQSIEGHRFSKDRLISFFQDMLAENINKKGYLQQNQPNVMNTHNHYYNPMPPVTLPVQPTARSLSSSSSSAFSVTPASSSSSPYNPNWHLPTYASDSSSSYRGTPVSVSPLSSRSTPVSVSSLSGRSTPMSAFSSISRPNAPPASIATITTGPNAPPASLATISRNSKGNPNAPPSSPVSAQSDPLKGPYVSMEDLISEQVQNDYYGAVNGAFEALEKMNPYKAKMQTALQKVWGYTSKDAIGYMDPKTNKRTNHTMVTLGTLIPELIRKSYSKAEYQKIEEALTIMQQVNDENVDYNRFQVLYMDPKDWMNDRAQRIAQKKEYKGYGIASASTPTLKAHHVVLGKYYVDRQKLGNGVLDIRYAKNKHLTQIKPQYLSVPMKHVVNRILDEKKIDMGEYHKLNSSEKNLVRNLNDMFEVGTDFEDDDSFTEEFNIVMGSIRAGNTSDLLRQKAKKYILYAMGVGKLPRNVGIDLLHEIN
jgi:hypothetical protein